MPLATPASTPIFLKEMVAEVNEQRQNEPTNKGLFRKLVAKFNEVQPTLVACSRDELQPEDVVECLTELAALSLRLAAEGDPLVRGYRWPLA